MSINWESSWKKKLKIFVAAAIILASSAMAYLFSQDKKENPQVESTLNIDRKNADDEKEAKYREEIRKVNQRDKEHLRSIGVKID